MNRDELLAKWDSMTPRERDALVVEKVWGNQIHWEQDEWTDPYPVNEQDVTIGNFSTDLLDAWEVYETMRAKDCWVGVETFRGKYRCLIINKKADIDGECVADTVPEAICKAALISILESEESA